jgi:hypothetical protein
MSDGLAWGLVVSTVVASGAWIYQRAWERVETRRARYEAVLANLSAFTVGGLNPDKIDEVLAEYRKLWLTAPRNVTNAFTDFLDSIEVHGKYSDQDRADLLNGLIESMRKDASLIGMLIPIGSNPALSPATFRLRSASRPARGPIEDAMVTNATSGVAA